MLSNSVYSFCKPFLFLQKLCLLYIGVSWFNFKPKSKASQSHSQNISLMASWNRASSGNNDYWSSETKTTAVSYGSQGYGYAHSPPRSPSPPPMRAGSYDCYNNKHQNHDMEAVTYGQEDHGYNKMTQTNGMGAYGQEDHGYNKKTQINGMGVYGQENHGYNKMTQTNGMGAYGQEAHGYNKKTQINGTHGQGFFFGELVPSSFPPGTDAKVVSSFNSVDRDGSGFIDEKELKMALSSYSSTFSLRTIRLIMYAFARTNTKVVGPKEFIAVYYGLQQWKAMFQKFDRDRNGKMDTSELREALRGLGYPVSEAVLNMLVAKFDKTSGNRMSIGFDGFIECCITVKGLSDKFKEKDQMLTGSATFTYEAFMMTVLPFVVA